jgi:uncharacterized repeat protein (TIGR03803 family)
VDPTTRKETVLYAFTSRNGFHPDAGWQPNAGLIFDAKGNLYGTTAQGGNYLNGCSTSGCGVVFKVDPTTRKETVLYKFTGGADGAGPRAGLIFDAKGNLYGTTYNGGNNVNSCDGSGGSGCGVVFKVDPTTRKETVLYTFTGGADGAGPTGGLIFDAKGNLYGTTYNGGDLNLCYSGGCGVVFKLTP